VVEELLLLLAILDDELGPTSRRSNRPGAHGTAPPPTRSA
jgi:hypothetical protein